MKTCSIKPLLPTFKEENVHRYLSAIVLTHQPQSVLGASLRYVPWPQRRVRGAPHE